MTSFGIKLHYSVTPHHPNFSFSLYWDPSPFSYFLPVAFHTFSLYLSFSQPSCLPLSPSLPLSLLLSPTPTRPHSHPLLHLAPSILPTACDIKCRRRSEGSSEGALSLLSDGPQSQSLPLSGAEVYTHGKLIPMPCLPHIVLMSKVVRCADTRVTFSKDRHTVGSHYTQKQHIEWKQQREAGLMNGET